MTPEQRKAVCDEALSWAGTPYVTNAGVKGAGCDCALGPLAIYRACLDLPDIAPPKYVQQWNLHQGEERFLNYVRSLGATEVEHPEPGDFALFRRGRLFSHGAIVLDYPRIIHAVPGAGFIEADADAEYLLVRQPRYYFSF